MKRIKLLVLAASFCLPLSLFAQTATTPANSSAIAQNYTIDPEHSYVEFHISHFDFSYPSGKWFVNGNVVLDQQKPASSKVSITIPVAKIVTGIPELDKHLQTAEFFDSKQFPTATFVSEKVQLTSDRTANVTGLLTLHGVSKPITLHVKLNKIDMSPITNKQTAGFSGDAELKRSDFNMNNFLPGLNDKVKLHFEVEAGLAK